MSAFSLFIFYVPFLFCSKNAFSSSKSALTSQTESSEFNKAFCLFLGHILPVSLPSRTIFVELSSYTYMLVRFRRYPLCCRASVFLGNVYSLFCVRLLFLSVCTYVFSFQYRSGLFSAEYVNIGRTTAL